jgi:hypothetical protein
MELFIVQMLIVVIKNIVLIWLTAEGTRLGEISPFITKVSVIVKNYSRDQFCYFLLLIVSFYKVNNSIMDCEQ